MKTLSCDRILLAGFLRDQLEENDRLNFLFHLDDCTTCWDAVYDATKASHPHFYKRPTRRQAQQFVEPDLDAEVTEDSKEESEEVFEVA